MKYLLFELTNQEVQYALVSSEVLYLLNEKEYNLLVDAANQEVLKEVFQIKKEEILKLITFKGKTEVTIFDIKDEEIIKLDFKTNSIRKKFIHTFSDFKREDLDKKTRISPINALLLMLFTYSFIWAGTRPTPAEINPEGIRLRIAYFVVQFQEWLNGLIGQTAILIIGIMLLFILMYLIFRPEIWWVFRKERRYVNTKY